MPLVFIFRTACHRGARLFIAHFAHQAVKKLNSVQKIDNVNGQPILKSDLILQLDGFFGILAVIDGLLGDDDASKK